MTAQDRAFLDNEIVVAGSHPAKHNTFEVVERILAEGVEGDFAEAGACGGGQIAVMDYALRKHGQERIIHAFDSWEGIPKATEEDDESQKNEYGVRKPGEPLASSGKLLSSLENFLSNMDKWGARLENIKTYKGWLQDMLPVWDDTIHRPLALLRIDVDLTESVRLCARYLYPHLVPGGYCIFDDWYTSPSAQRQAILDYMDGRLELMEDFREVEGNPGTVYWRKPR